LNEAGWHLFLGICLARLEKATTSWLEKATALGCIQEAIWRDFAFGGATSRLVACPGGLPWVHGG
ncbi:MAG: hypothetical protein LKJ10_07545, partial [Ancrocorticia sp.]|nr:hypothetical protein [Ancrocorticia sp.]